jgi:GNAT superfamily N-acetyltransferase
MKTEPFVLHDLKRISGLQPSDWPDIIPYFYFYIEADYCEPIKVEIDNKIVGIGTTISYKKSAWLAHIIVHPEYRCRGIGSGITNYLVDQLKTNRIKTIWENRYIVKQALLRKPNTYSSKTGNIQRLPVRTVK